MLANGSNSDETTTSRWTNPKEVSWLVMVGGCFLIVAGATLTWHGYWSDEFHTINAVKAGWGELVQERASKGHPPLFFLLEKCWVSVLGGSEASFRSLPMLCGLGSLLLTYGITRRHAGHWSACLACLLVLGSATQLMICQLARSYALLQFLVTAETALLIANKRPTIDTLVGSFLLSAAACFTHGAALIAVPAQFVAAALTLPSRWKCILAGVAGSLTYLPFVLAFPRLDNFELHVSWIAGPSVDSLLRFPAILQFGRQLPFLPATLQVAAALILALLAVGAMFRRQAQSFLALQWFFTWAAAAAAAGFGVGIVSVERYFAPTLICQAASIAILVESVSTDSKAVARTISSVVIAMSVASAALYFAIPPFTPWREMAQLIHEHRVDGELVVVAAPKVLATPFAHYYPGKARFIGHRALYANEASVGIWVCFRETRADIEAQFIPSDVRHEYPDVRIYRFHRGYVVHLARSRETFAASQ